MGRLFQKGQSGNPGGRPAAEREVFELARDKSVRAIGRLAEWMESDNPRASVAACQAILDRAYGKPTQPISGDHDKPPIETRVTVDGLAKLPKADRAALRDIARKLSS